MVTPDGLAPRLCMRYSRRWHLDHVAIRFKFSVKTLRQILADEIRPAHHPHRLLVVLLDSRRLYGTRSRLVFGACRQIYWCLCSQDSISL